MTITERSFGSTKSGDPVACYTLQDKGMSAEILSYGGTIRTLSVPAPGGIRDVALGFDNMAGYEAQGDYIGALVGRVANRIGGAHFSLNGQSCPLSANDGPNCLHGGFRSFDKRIWRVHEENGALVCSLHSPDLDGGFPGDVDIAVRYKITDGALCIEYSAEGSADTPLSLTNHCYFNLGGHGLGSIADHVVRICSDTITPVNGALIPTGNLLDVTGTPFDLREQQTLGAGLISTHPQLVLSGGYDHNFVLSSEPQRELTPAAALEYKGLRMTCLTTQPGIQFYSGNFLSGRKGKGGAIYGKHSGLCLETQSWPDAVNRPEFPDCILRKGAVYRHTTVYSFTQA
ncbi:MAG: galactose mutarotase [Oscillospiraceae bacterium]|jgi:aldose 1-epimerase|nr:galactose mutarotase [Oscillospiraceae bacterium]